MKFRCERDELVEALVGRRSGRDQPGQLAPGAERHPLRADRRPAAPDRQRPRPDDPGRADGGRRATTAWPSSRPSSSATSSGRCRAGRGRRRGRGRGRRDHRRAGRSSRVRTIPATEFPRLPEPAERRRRAAGRGVRRGAAPGDGGGQHRGDPPDPHRRADERRGRRACAWWPPTRTAWPCATCRARRCWPRARACWCRRARCKELGRLLGGADEVTLTPGRARRHLRRSAHDRLTTRLIEGEFPNYRGLIPASQPNRLTRGPRGAARRGAARAAAGHRRHAGAPGACEPDGPRAGGHRPGGRPGPRGARRQVRGRRADRGVQPGVPHRRHRGRPRATRSRSRPSTR